MQNETDVVFAVENMFPLRARGAEVAPYAPTWNPVQMDYPNVTLDLSHTAVSGSDALAMADELGGRLAHVHLADGTGLAYRDEHLVPGRGTQPCAPLLGWTAAGYRGVIVLEVKTFRAPTQEARQADLAEALEFTRLNLAGPDGAAGSAAASPAAARPNGASADGACASPARWRGPGRRPGWHRPGWHRPGWHRPGPPGPARLVHDPLRADGAGPGRPRALAGRDHDQGCMLPVMTPNTLITVAPTGAEPDKATVPALPVTLDELVATAVDCEAAWAAAIHVHIRDAQAQPTLDLGPLKEPRRRSGTHLLIVQLSTGGAVTDGFGARLAGSTRLPTPAR